MAKTQRARADEIRHYAQQMDQHLADRRNPRPAPLGHPPALSPRERMTRLFSGDPLSRNYEVAFSTVYEAPVRSPRRQLYTYEPGAFDGQGRVAVVVGDLDAAAAVAVHVPGIGSTIQSIGIDVDNAENHYIRAGQLTGMARAVVAWTGYSAPAGRAIVGRTLTQAIAEQGGRRLADDVAGITASREQPPAIHLMGHSYGSTTTAHAGHNGRLANYVSSITLLGSPGAGPVQRAAHFGIGDRVYVASASRDLVTYLGGRRALTTNRYIESVRLLGQGIDPAQEIFGARRVRAEYVSPEHNAGITAPHVGYFLTDEFVAGQPVWLRDDPSALVTESLENVSRILTGNTDPAYEAHRRANDWFVDPAENRSTTVDLLRGVGVRRTPGRSGTDLTPRIAAADGGAVGGSGGPRRRVTLPADTRGTDPRPRIAAADGGAVGGSGGPRRRVTLPADTRGTPSDPLDRAGVQRSPIRRPLSPPDARPPRIVEGGPRVLGSPSRSLASSPVGDNDDESSEPRGGDVSTPAAARPGPRSFLDLSEDGDDESREPRGGDVSTPAAARPGPRSFLDLSEDGDDESSEPRGGDVSTPAAARPGPRSFLDLSEDGDDESSEPRGGDVSTPAAARPGPRSFLDLESPDDWPPGPDTDFLSPRGRPLREEILRKGLASHTEADDRADTEQPVRSQVPAMSNALHDSVTSSRMSSSSSDSRSRLAAAMGLGRIRFGDESVGAEILSGEHVVGSGHSAESLARQYVTVDFETRQRNLDSATPEMGALAQHLRRLADAGHEVEVWVEGGGARLWSSAGLNRATSVQRHLTDLVGDAARRGPIEWHRPTNRGTSSGNGPIKVGDDNRRQVVIWWEAKPAPVSEDHGSDEVASVIPPGDHDGQSTQHTGDFDEPDEIDGRHAAYQMIAPGLAGIAERPPFRGDINDPEIRTFSSFPRTRAGELSEDAIANFVDTNLGAENQTLLGVMREAAVIVDDDLDDGRLHELLSETDVANYPELLSYLARSDRTAHIDGNADMAKLDLSHEGVGFHFSEGDRLVPQRQKLVLGALSALRAAGYTLPGTLDVYLPRYFRRLEVRAISGADGLPQLDITEQAVMPDMAVDHKAGFAPPDFMFVNPSAVGANDSDHVLIHEMMPGCISTTSRVGTRIWYGPDSQPNITNWSATSATTR